MSRLPCFNFIMTGSPPRLATDISSSDDRPLLAFIWGIRITTTAIGAATTTMPPCWTRYMSGASPSIDTSNLTLGRATGPGRSSRLGLLPVQEANTEKSVNAKPYHTLFLTLLLPPELLWSMVSPIQLSKYTVPSSNARKDR